MMGQFNARTAMLAGLVASGLLLSGCANVELNGGIFDALGVSNVGKVAEPKMDNRPGLVIPPSTASLPAPGSNQQQQTALASNGEAFPVNPEEAKKQQNADILRRHNAFCEKARQREKAGLTETVESSPWGSCHQSVLRNLTGKDLAGKRAPGTQ